MAPVPPPAIPAGLARENLARWRIWTCRFVPPSASAGALVVQHIWYETGGMGSAGESTPAEPAER